jgi:MFS family permease
VLGGVIDGIDWHWIFWLNVPIGLTLIPLSTRRLSESFGPRPKLESSCRPRSGTRRSTPASACSPRRRRRS